MNDFPVLTLLWLTPLIGALVVMLLPSGARRAARAVALLASLVVLSVTVALAVGFDPGGEQYQFVEARQWIPAFGAGYTLGLDGIALVLVALTALLMPLLLLAGWRDTDDDERRRATHTYVSLMLLTQALVLIAFTTLDVLMFYVAFEAMLIPLYFLIGGFGGSGEAGGRVRSAAAVKFLLYNLFGGLVMLAAVIGLYAQTAAAGLGPDGGGTFDFRVITGAVATGALDISPGAGALLFGGFTLAFAIKAPLWPFHTWLPGAAVAATPASAVLMMAVVDKVGTFAMLRYSLQLFPDAAQTFAPVIVTLAVVSIIYGGLMAIAQTDVLRLVAYASVSHFGFIILGIFAMTDQAHAGSALYMVNHGLATAALFLVAGFLVRRHGTREIHAYGGVQKVAPVLAGTFLVAGMATLSLPGLAPFISEFLVFVGTYGPYPVAAVASTLTLVLAAVYVLWTYQRMMGGPVADGLERTPDLNPRELTVLAPLIAALVVLGVYPAPALEVVEPAVESTLSVVESADQEPGARPSADQQAGAQPVGGDGR